jgi:hypothetical protein
VPRPAVFDTILMNFTPWNKRLKKGASLALLVSLFVVTGCNRDETKVYHVDKDDEASSQSAPTSAATDTNSPPADTPVVTATPTDSQLNFAVPAGWEKKPPSQLRVASLTAPGPDKETADVSVIPLPVVGRDMDLINLWRSQVNLPPTADPAAVTQAEPVAIGADQGRLFRYVSEGPMIGKFRQQILVAMLVRGTTTWFFRIVGPTELVDSQRGKFIEFLKSISFEDKAPEQPVVAPAPATTSNQTSPSIWKVPADWRAIPAAQFLIAQYSMGNDDAKAQVNVAELKGDGGGLLANANRWRDQIGLPPLDENGLQPLVQSLDVPGGHASLVDFAGKDSQTGVATRLIAAMVEQDGQSWFYKLMGDPQTVAAQKNAFTQFIQSAHYANAR